MRKTILCAAVVFALSPIAFGQGAGGGGGKDTAVTGWVLDSACAYTKGLDKPISASCAKACAHAGSPLVILRDDGTIFLPIDSNTPSASQNEKLMPFAGERVKVSGTEYMRGSSHAIVIAKIERQGS